MEILKDVILYCLITVCAVSDVLYGKIYNKITYPIIGIGVFLAIFGGYEILRSSLIGLLVGFILFFLVFLMGGFGGGDVKLMAAIGALKGYPFVLYASFYSALAGGIISLGVIIFKGKFLYSMKNIFYVLFSYPMSIIFPGVKPVNLDPENSQRIPFGFAICIGTLWTVIEFTLGISLFDIFDGSRFFL